MENTIYSILRKFLNLSPNLELLLNDEEQLCFFDEAVSHQIHLLVYSSFYECLKNDINQRLKTKWFHVKIYSNIRLKKCFDYFFSIVESFSNNNIKVILLKGAVLAEIYNEPLNRIMGDFDCLIEKSDYNQIKTILETFDYTLKEASFDSDKHVTFYHDEFLPIEIHFTLVNNEFPDNLKLIDSIIKENIIEYKYQHIYMPKPEAHVLYLLIHMHTHFYTSGIGYRNLLDLVILINSCTVFDWQYLYDKIHKVKLINYSLSIFNICEEELGLELPDYYRVISLDKKLVKLLKDDIYISGVHGVKTPERIAHNALSKHAESKKHFNFIYFLFPPYKHLIKHYSYLQNRKYLLPVAWIHRFIVNLFTKKYAHLKILPSRKHIENRRFLKEYFEE